MQSKFVPLVLFLVGRCGRTVLITGRCARLIMFTVFGLTGCNSNTAIAPSPQPANLGSVEVLYKSVTPIAGFQFGVTGANVTGARNGAAEAAAFTVSTGNNTVIGFSFTGTTIPAGEDVLVVLAVVGSGDACLIDLVVSDSSGNGLDASVEGCLTILIHA